MEQNRIDMSAKFMSVMTTSGSKNVRLLHVFTSFRWNIPYKLFKVAVISRRPVPCHGYEAIPLADRGPNP